MRPILFAGQSYPSTTSDLLLQRTVNFYPIEGVANPTSIKGVKPILLYPTEGSTVFAQTGQSRIRGGIVVNSLVYFVAGGTFYTCDVNGVTTAKGALNTTLGQVCFADITDIIAFVDGSDGWYYTISTGVLARITDVDFPSGCTSITSLDGYFIIHDPGTQKLRISNLGSASAWSPLDYTNVQTSSDNLVRVIAYKDMLLAMGENSLEQYYDTGAVDFPFDPVRGGAVPFGLAAEFAVTKTSESLVFLARSERGSITPVSLNGSSVTAIFNKGVIEEINTFKTYNDAVMFVYQRDSHEFIVLDFPTEGHTYVFDTSNGLVHERESTQAGSTQYTGWYPSCYFNLNGIHLCGSKYQGTLFKLDPNTYTENSLSIRRRRRIPALISGVGNEYPSAGVNYSTVNKIEMQFQTNAQLTMGQGANPQVILRISRDGGHTFDQESTRDLGLLGEFSDLAIWDCLGTSKKWCAEMVVTDPIKWTLLEVYADIQENTP